MKLISNNLIHFILAFVLSIAPLQSISASVSDCLDTNNTMHHSMNEQYGSDEQMAKPDKQDCCETTACDMTHCAGFVAIAVLAEIQNDIFYTLSDAFIKPAERLTPFFPSSLYRPPKA